MEGPVDCHQQRPAEVHVAAVTAQQPVAALLVALEAQTPMTGSTHPNWTEFMNRHLKLHHLLFPSPQLFFTPKFPPVKNTTGQCLHS